LAISSTDITTYIKISLNQKAIILFFRNPDFFFKSNEIQSRFENNKAWDVNKTIQSWLNTAKQRK
ncbi:hypothetical protein SNEBB_004783, partial [Seison nebaliae]